MFCQKCGREIPDQAKFCNYCGAQINNAHTPSAPQQRPVQQPTQPKKKGKLGKSIFSIVVILVVFFSVRYITADVLTGQKKQSSFEQGFNEGLTADSDVSTAMMSCSYGALYQNDFLTYGMTKLNVPGYSLLPGEGDERDWLMSSDGGCLVAAYKQLEIIDVSFDASREEEMLNSFKQSYSDASMIDYQKYYVNGFPVIRFITGCTVDGAYQYQGELIVFPDETTDETIRLDMFVDAESGYGAEEINKIFDTLEVSPEFELKPEDTQVRGINRITVK